MHCSPNTRFHFYFAYTLIYLFSKQDFYFSPQTLINFIFTFFFFVHSFFPYLSVLNAVYCSQFFFFNGFSRFFSARAQVSASRPCLWSPCGLDWTNPLMIFPRRALSFKNSKNKCNNVRLFFNYFAFKTQIIIFFPATRVSELADSFLREKNKKHFIKGFFVNKSWIINNNTSNNA